MPETGEGAPQPKPEQPISPNKTDDKPARRFLTNPGKLLKRAALGLMVTLGAAHAKQAEGKPINPELAKPNITQVADKKLVDIDPNDKAAVHEYFKNYIGTKETHLKTTIPPKTQEDEKNLKEIREELGNAAGVVGNGFNKIDEGLDKVNNDLDKIFK